MLLPLPRCSDWTSSSLISSNRVSLPRKGHRVGLHIVLFEAQVTRCCGWLHWIGLPPMTQLWKRRNELVDCFNHKLPALDGVDDVVGIGSPDKGSWVSIGLGDEAFDRCLEIDDRMEHTPL